MNTMEELIVMEAKEIVRLTVSNLQPWTDRMVDIRRRAQNIVRTVERSNAK